MDHVKDEDFFAVRDVQTIARKRIRQRGQWADSIDPAAVHEYPFMFM
jgi:hypothetical protein